MLGLEARLSKGEKARMFEIVNRSFESRGDNERLKIRQLLWQRVLGQVS